MATATRITRNNYTTLLVRSTNARGATPNGNVFIDAANDTFQLITYEELTQVDLGSGLEDNPLRNATKIEMLALYFFVLQEVEADTLLQGYRRFVDAVGNKMATLVGATSFLNGVKLASGTVDVNGAGGSLGDDRLKIAGSGMTEFAVTNGGNVDIDRIYTGARSLQDIQATSQPYYLLSQSSSEAHRQAATPVDFSKPGDVDELIQAFGSTANGDAGAGNFDYTDYVLILSVREFGYTISEVNSTDSGVPELGAVSVGYGLGHSLVSELSGITEADVWGGAQIAPYTGLGFTILTTPTTETSFNEADGDFTYRVTNSGGATRVQIRAWLDKLMQSDADENANTGVTGVFKPKRSDPLYTINSVGKMVTRQGLFIENIPASDEQDVIFVDDAGDQKTRPFNVEVRVKLLAIWFNDPAPYFRIVYEDGAAAQDYATDTAVTVNDASAVALIGDDTDGRIVSVSTYYELRFSYAYDSNTQAGLSAGADKDLVLRVGGIRDTKEREVTFTITRQSLINVDGSTDLETNAP